MKESGYFGKTKPSVALNIKYVRGGRVSLSDVKRKMSEV